jgi:hypothetical protein
MAEQQQGQPVHPALEALRGQIAEPGLSSEKTKALIFEYEWTADCVDGLTEPVRVGGVTMDRDYLRTRLGIPAEEIETGARDVDSRFGGSYQIAICKLDQGDTLWGCARDIVGPDATNIEVRGLAARFGDASVPCAKAPQLQPGHVVAVRYDPTDIPDDPKAGKGYFQGCEPRPPSQCNILLGR